MSSPTTATVETLTAEVRVLMVGNRQITLSVAKQLDRVPLKDVTPMGRVSISDRPIVIGKHTESGALVTAAIPAPEATAILFEEDTPESIFFCARTKPYRDGSRLVRIDGVTVEVTRYAHEVDNCPLYPRGPECGPTLVSGNWQPIIDAVHAAERSRVAHNKRVAAAHALPLIVLAGLR